MNHSLSDTIVITSAAESKVEGNLKLVLIRQRSSGSGRKLHTKEEGGVPSTRVVCLAVKNIVDNLGREEDGTLSQIRSDKARSHLVLRERSSGLLIR